MNDGDHGTEHAAAGGDACTWGLDGCCTGCGVSRSECTECGGVGYHRSGCSEEEDSMGTTIDNVTDEQLRALRSEAASAGDYMQVAVAELAMTHHNGGNNTTDPVEYELLDDDEREELREMSTLDALRSCVEAIRDAEAQSEEAAS